MASGAKWLLLDEPAAGLNPAEKNALVNVIRRIWQDGTTILFVEHDMRVVGDLAQRVIVLDQGTIIADGSPTEIRRSESVLRAYLGSDDLMPKAVAQRGAADRGDARELLEVDSLEVRYGGLIALTDISLNVRGGEIVSVLGANGAGKTSLLKAVTRTLPAYAGHIRMDGADITLSNASDVIHAGIALVPEGRELFNSLTVVDNLRLGAYSRINRLRQYIPDFFRSREADEEIEATLTEVFRLFPKLKERAKQVAGTLSGGEGQMLAIGRALMSRPRLLLLDEPSLGLAPKIIMDIFAKLVELRNQGLTIMLVEQNAHAALELSDRAYVLSTGRMAAEGPSRMLSKSTEIRKSYLGISESV